MNTLRNCLWLGELAGLTEDVFRFAKNWFAITERGAALPKNLQGQLVLDFGAEFNVECYWQRREQILSQIQTWIDLHGPIDGIIAPSEYTVELGAWLRSELNVHGPLYSELAVLRDKLWQKQKITEGGVLTSSFTSAKDPVDVQQWLEKEERKVVLKPRKQAGSRGVQILNSPKEVFTALDQTPQREDFIIENFVDAPVIHIDGLIRDGKLLEAVGSRYLDTCLHWLTEKSPMGSTLINDPETSKKVFDFAGQVLGALGIMNSVFHLEAFELSNGEYCFLEIAGRPGGAAIVPSLKVGLGLDLMQEKILADLLMETQYEKRTQLPSLGWVVTPMPTSEAFVVKGHHGLDPETLKRAGSKFMDHVQWVELPPIGKKFNLTYDEGLPSGKFVAFHHDHQKTELIRSNLIDIAKNYSLEIAPLPTLILDGIKPIHKKVLEHIHNVHLLVRPVNLGKDDGFGGYKSVHVLREDATLDEWVDLIRKLWPDGVARIVSFHDDDQLRALHLSRALGLSYPYTESAIEETQNKVAMRKKLMDQGVSPVRFKFIKVGPFDQTQEMLDDHRMDQIEQEIISFGFPSLLKPAAGVASKNIYFFHSLSCLKKARESLRLLQTGGDFVLEEYIAGEEFSVECFSLEGEHYFFGVTTKSLFENSFVERGHCFPTPMPSDRLSKVQETVENILKTLEVTEGPTHTEIKITPEGEVKVIETHTRWGGDRITEMVGLTYGIDLFELSALHALGRIEDCRERLQSLRKHDSMDCDSQRGIYAVRFFTPPVTMKEKQVLCHGTQELQSKGSAFQLSKGRFGRFEGLRSSFDRWGSYLVKGKSPEDCSRLLDKALSPIGWQILEEE